MSRFVECRTGYFTGVGIGITVSKTKKKIVSADLNLVRVMEWFNLLNRHSLGKLVDWKRQKLPMRTPLTKENRVVQIEVTTRCNLACFNCSRALAQSPKLDMPLTLFEQAVLACKDWVLREQRRRPKQRCVLSLIGGNPCVSPLFSEYAAILAHYLPEENRGLFTNNIYGKGEVIRQYFGPRSLIHFVGHGKSEAAKEVRQEVPFVHPGHFLGEHRGSDHASIFIAAQDFVSEEDLWRRVSNCRYDIEWSSMVVLEPPDFKTLGGYSCEIASTHARMNSQPLGIRVEPGWLDLPLEAFKHQYDFACRRCGGCLNLDGVRDLSPDGCDQFSKTNAGLVQLTASSRRRTEIVTELPDQDGHPPTDYLRRYS